MLSNPMQSNAHCVAQPSLKSPPLVVLPRYSSLNGMMGWAFAADQICEFNMAALAEWSWNANGRSVPEFAYAFGLRSGMSMLEVVDRPPSGHL